MSYNYSSYVTTLQTLLVAADTQGASNLNAMLPNIIDYAEQRIYRELDFLTTLTPITTTASTASRNLVVPSNVIVIQSANVITPSLTTPDSGTRNSMRRVSAEFMNFAWPGATTLNGTPSIPEYYAVLNNTNLTSTNYSSTQSNYTLLMAPPCDAQYVVEMLSTVRPLPLSSTNSVTFLTVYLPDLFLQASMVFAAGYQRDFGQQSDDPQLATSWEALYQGSKASANIEELRKKAQSSDWESFTPSPVADQSR